MYFWFRPSNSRINRQQRAKQALVITVRKDGQNRSSCRHYELLYPDFALSELELEAAVHIDSHAFSVRAFIRCCHNHLYALKPVRLSRLKRPYEVIAEYDNTCDLVRIDPELFRQARSRSSTKSISFLEYRRRKRDNNDQWTNSYSAKAKYWGIVDPRELGGINIADLEPLPLPSTSEQRDDTVDQKSRTRTFTEWHRLATDPTKRCGRRRKERMSEKEWIADYFSSFSSMGWICRNKGIGPDRTRLSAHELIQHTELWFQKDATALLVHTNVGQVDDYGILSKASPHLKSPVNIWVRIVRGRRVDVNRGICCRDNGTATRILPKWKPTDESSMMLAHGGLWGPQSPLQKFYVDFDGKLFEQATEEIWRPCTDDPVLELYRAYRATSPHYQSFRPYHLDMNKIAPHTPLPEQRQFPSSSGESPFDRFSKKVWDSASSGITRLV